MILRRLRGRFGISAPRVDIRAHIPWYWRVLVTLLLLAATILLGTWVYDTGRRFAGYDSRMAEQQLSELRDRVGVLEHEAERLRSIGNASESTLQIERTAQQGLSEQVKRLETENGRLREDLAAFENLATGDTKSETVGIHRLQVEPDPSVAGNYHYRLLLAAPGLRSEKEFRGRLQLVVTVQQDAKTDILNIPDAGAPDAQKYLVSFKYFRLIEGSFALPPGAILKKFEVRLTQGGTVVVSQQAPI